jgi:hypothetical protein
VGSGSGLQCWGFALVLGGGVPRGDLLWCRWTRCDEVGDTRLGKPVCGEGLRRGGIRCRAMRVGCGIALRHGGGDVKRGPRRSRAADPKPSVV